MIQLLAQTREKSHSQNNPFYPEGKLRYYDSLIAMGGNESQIMMWNYHKTETLLRLGEEEQVIEIMENFIMKNEKTAPATTRIARATLALAYLRLGERTNCIAGHVSESCIMPIRGLGVHRDRYATVKAKEAYLKLLESDSMDLESRWLLNIVCMTLGEYPKEIPSKWLLPGLDADTSFQVNAFHDIANPLGLDVKNMAGGTLVDDFDNDGYLDIVTSGWGLEEGMHYFRNNTDGTFSDLSSKTELGEITGGLNITQADYNNDGYADILVLRGAWKGNFGKEPNSLLRNNGDGTFTDVTTQCGLLSFHPTQSGTWNDFNHDGWLDLFIGNESMVKGRGEKHPCELYRNNKDGTFTEIAKSAKCDVIAFVKGVTSGDYDNDGLADIFISTLDGNKILLKNKTSKKGEIVFEDVTEKAGLSKEMGSTFPTWFWDYNNDGWLDIFACGYDFNRSLAFYAAAETMKISLGNSEKMFLFENNKDGTFTNVAKKAGLDKYVFAMGSNFGDIDNDGYLDMYLGTGNPVLNSIIPNKMFKNVKGKQFVDVTTSARVGHLQKGHAVSFADLDNDGDQDIYTDLGGAYIGDAYQNSFFLNPGQGTNNWICIVLEGSASNRSAIGTRLKLSFKENNEQRTIYRDVNSGGSFGSSPLRREIGIGQAKIIDEIEIKWNGSGKTQRFRNIAPNQFVKIVEGSEEVRKIHLKSVDLTPLTKHTVLNGVK